MTQGQFEAVSAEALEQGVVEAQALATGAETATVGTPEAQALAASAESLTNNVVEAQTLATSAEILISSVLSTTDMQALALSMEVLIPAPPPLSNVFDYLGVEHEAYQWDGSVLVPMTFGVG